MDPPAYSCTNWRRHLFTSQFLQGINDNACGPMGLHDACHNHLVLKHSFLPGLALLPPSCLFELFIVWLRVNDFGIFIFFHIGVQAIKHALQACYAEGAISAFSFLFDSSLVILIEVSSCLSLRQLAQSVCLCFKVLYCLSVLCLKYIVFYFVLFILQ